MEEDLWIDRLVTARIREGLDTRPAIFITGMRQTGKTSLLKRNFPEYTFISFDKIENVREAEENPVKFLNSFSGPVILDEAQYVPKIFREIKYKIDENRNKKGRWILTGSQNFLLMKDISESLAGRIGIFNMNTLSSGEIRNSKRIAHRIKESLILGGFPEIWSNKNIVPENFYDDYITTYGERDLRRILDVTNLRDFQRLLKSCAIRTGQLLNYTDLARDVGVSGVTIKSWINALETGGIIHLLQPYYRNLGKRLIKAPKLYFSDTGLLCHLLGIKKESDLDNHPIEGSIWENYVFMELIKTGNYKIGYNLFYYRDQNGVEIDFLIESAKNITLIEAKKAERPPENKLNFKKVSPLFPKYKVENFLACTTPENRIMKFKEYSIWNPMLVSMDI